MLLVCINVLISDFHSSAVQPKPHTYTLLYMGTTSDACISKAHRYAAPTALRTTHANHFAY